VKNVIKRKRGLFIVLSVLLILVLGGTVFAIAQSIAEPPISLARMYSFDTPFGIPSGYEVCGYAIEEEHQRQFYLFKRSNARRRGEIEVISETTGTHTISMRARDQASGGTRFTTAGSGFHWSDGGRAIPAHITLSCDERIPIDFSVGRVGGGDFSAVIQPSQVDEFVHLYVSRTFEVREWMVSFGQNGDYGTRQESDRFISVVPVSLELVTVIRGG